MGTWTVVAVAAALCYLLKYAGMAVPSRYLDVPLVSRLARLMPLALLGALVAVQTFASAGGLVIDARLAGVLAAALALMLRAPFIVAVLVAAAVAAGLRAVGLG